MEESKRLKNKIFLWDQFVRPIYLLLNIHQLQALLLALLIMNFFILESVWVFFILVISLAIIFTSEMIKYYKSGEFIHNYRNYKSERGEYRDYRKLTKVLKKDNEKDEFPKDIKNKLEGKYEYRNRFETKEDATNNLKAMGFSDEEINKRVKDDRI